MLYIFIYAHIVQNPSKEVKCADTVTQKEMQALYNLLRIPYKKGLVLWEEGVNIDCASVFRQGSEWAAPAVDSPFAAGGRHLRAQALPILL